VAQSVVAMAETITAARGHTATGQGGTCSPSFPARADQVRQARAVLRPMLADCPVADEVLLVCSELAGNAVQHSVSARPGGHFTVRMVIRTGAYVWIEVEDNGGGWAAQERTGEHGRGLLIVDELAAYRDIRGDDTGRVVCVRLDWPAAVKTSQAVRSRGNEGSPIFANLVAMKAP
jgi:anti-sigma regulatory factor (Ser/Thr protein kinase)